MCWGMAVSTKVQDIVLYTSQGKPYHPTVKSIKAMAVTIHQQSVARSRLEEKILMLEEEAMALAQRLEEKRQQTARLAVKLQSERRKRKEAEDRLRFVMVEDAVNDGGSND